MKQQPPGQMSPDQFRKFGYHLIDWIADYWERVEDYPVLSQVAPGEIRSKLPQDAPLQGESFEEILRDLEGIILPGLTHWQSPNFFAYFPANNSGPSVLGELVSAGLGVQGMLWATSPACTELEIQVLDWLVQMLDLPGHFHSCTNGGGVIQDTASSASLCALLAAREDATGLVSNRTGIRETLTAYTSNQAHSAVEKAVKIAGIGSENLRFIGVDSQFRMRPDALRQAVEEDRQRGHHPFFVSATVGTTSSGAIDPVAKIGPICREQNLWLHVDAAMAGTAALCPEFRPALNRGLEFADSYCFNPHKWMLVNFDCDCFWVRRRKALIDALSILPEYLRNQATESGNVIDYRDWQVPLGRRFRALKLWFVIRHYGVQGLRQHVRHHVDLARAFAGWVQEESDFELATPRSLSLVCFRHRGGDAVNQRLLDRLNRSGKVHLTHTKLDGQLTLRMSIGQPGTRFEHVEQAWHLIQQLARELAGS